MLNQSTIITGDISFPKTKEFNMILENNNIAFKRRENTKVAINYYGVIIANKKEYDSLNSILPNSINQTFMSRNSDLYYVYGDGGSFNNGNKDTNLPTFSTYCTLVLNSKADPVSFVKTVNECFIDDLNIIPFDRGISMKVDTIENGTNNQAELFSIITGLRELKKTFPTNRLDIILSSDSQYVMKSGSEWIFKWAIKNWKNNSNENIKNIDMFKELFAYLNDPLLNIYFRWQRGHQNKLEIESQWMNYVCDIACNVEINRTLEIKYNDLFSQKKHKRNINKMIMNP